LIARHPKEFMTLAHEPLQGESMSRKTTFTAALLCAALLITSTLKASETPREQEVPKTPDPGIQAFESASAAGRFLLVLFRKTDAPSPLSQSFETVRASMAESLPSVVINTGNPAESGLVERYNVTWAPLPMVVVLAPNSAITGTFRAPFTEAEVRAAFLSPASQACMLAFQQRRLVFVCVQGKETLKNEEAMDGVNRFKEDPRLGRMASVVTVDPGDPLEQGLLAQLRIGSQPASAETLLLAPPGRVLGKWTGPTSKEAITQVLVAQARAQQACQVPGCQDPTCVTPPETQGGAK
jgi:hypothetical protein